jgi:hypothetical protein
MKILFVIVFVFGLIGCFSENAEIPSPRLAIYQVDLIQNDMAPALDEWTGDPQYLKSFVTQEYVLATGVYQDPPILSDKDIVELCENQCFEITVQAAEKWDSVGSISVMSPLVIVIDGVPCYAAMLWSPLSSFGCRLPKFGNMTLNNHIIVFGGHISDFYLKVGQVASLERAAKWASEKT